MSRASAARRAASTTRDPGTEGLGHDGRIRRRGRAARLDDTPADRRVGRSCRARPGGHIGGVGEVPRRSDRRRLRRRRDRRPRDAREGAPPARRCRRTTAGHTRTADPRRCWIPLRTAACRPDGSRRRDGQRRDVAAGRGAWRRTRSAPAGVHRGGPRAADHPPRAPSGSGARSRPPAGVVSLRGRRVVVHPRPVLRLHHDPTRVRLAPALRAGRGRHRDGHERRRAPRGRPRRLVLRQPPLPRHPHHCRLRLGSRRRR